MFIGNIFFSKTINFIEKSNIKIKHIILKSEQIRSLFSFQFLTIQKRVFSQSDLFPMQLNNFYLIKMKRMKTIHIKDTYF